MTVLRLPVLIPGDLGLYLQMSPEAWGDLARSFPVVPELPPGRPALLGAHAWQFRSIWRLWVEEGEERVTWKTSGKSRTRLPPARLGCGAGG